MGDFFSRFSHKKYVGVKNLACEQELKKVPRRNFFEIRSNEQKLIEIAINLKIPLKSMW
jgi:hypothetical protein